MWIILLAWVFGIAQLAYLRVWRGAAVCAWAGAGLADVSVLYSLRFVYLVPPYTQEPPGWAEGALGVVFLLFAVTLVLLVRGRRGGLQFVQAVAVLLALAWLVPSVRSACRLDVSDLVKLIVVAAHAATVAFIGLGLPKPPIADE